MATTLVRVYIGEKEPCRVCGNPTVKVVQEIKLDSWHVPFNNDCPGWRFCSADCADVFAKGLALKIERLIIKRSDD